MSTRSHLPLVGRTDELDRARRALGLGDAATPGGLLLLSGDAGIGKTSVITALSDEAQAAGFRVLLGHCVGGAGAALPYLPFVEILARLDDTEPERVDVLLETYAALARILPRRSSSAARDAGDHPDTDRAWVLEAAHGALENLARDRPLLVVVEDLHWADESSRDLLTLLFTRSFSTPVSLVASYRSDDLHRRHPLRESLALWTRLPGLARLDLTPLADADIADMVRRLPGELSSEAVGEIVRRAEGNAFFAEELASAAAHWMPMDLGLSRLLLSRVELLDDPTQEVVRVAAAVGRRVPQRLLERVSGLAAPELERHVREAVERHVLEPMDADSYVFRHALLAEAVYEDLLPSERLRLHRACSAALQEDPSLGTTADLARHARAAGETEVAVRASLAAGDAALAVGGPAEALAHYEEGLQLLASDDGSGHGLTVGAAEAALRLGRTNRARALLQARLDTSGVKGGDRAELLGCMAYALRVTENDIDRDALTSEAVTLLDGATAWQRVYVLTRRLECLLDLDRDDEAATVAQAAMEAAAADPGRSHVDLMTNLARLVERAGDPAESIRRLEDLVASASSTDLPVVRALHAIGRVHYGQDNLGAALTAYSTGAERATAIGLRWAPYAFDALVMAVTVAYELGEWDRALELADHGTGAEPPFAGAALDATSSLVLAARGSDLPAAWYARIKSFWKRDGLHAIQSGAATLDALGYAGDLDGVQRVHTEVVAYIRALWNMPTFAGEVRLAALALGRTADAVAALPPSELGARLAWADGLYETALSIFTPDSGRPPPNAEGRAWTARATGEYLRLRHAAGHEVDPDDWRAAWQDATELFALRRDPYETARSQLGLAEVLLAVGDRATADAVLAEAGGTADRLGAAPLCAAIATLGGSGPAPADLLTPREREVLALIAAGRSNGQIGTALFISTKTASVHVSNILAKLGARSRGEAAALARQRGLVH